MRKSKLQKRLESFGLDINLYRRAQQFFEDRGFMFNFDGRASYRNRFHLCIAHNGCWRAFRTDNPADIMDQPAAIMASLMEN